MISSDDQTLNDLAGRVVVISGADGFLGAQLVKKCLDLHAQVYGIVRSKSSLKRLSSSLPGLTLLETDLALEDQRTFMLSLPQDADMMIHAAAAGIKPEDNMWPQLWRVNVHGTKVMLDAAVKTKCKRFVYVGSSFEYDQGRDWPEDTYLNPRTLYGVTKTSGWMLCLQYAREHHLSVVGFRPFYLYGPGEDAGRFVSLVCRCKTKGVPLAMTPGEQIRDFVFIDDALRAILLGCIAQDVDNQMFNIASGQGTSLRQAVALLEDVTGTTFPVAWGKNPYRPMEWQELTGNTKKAKERLNFTTRVPLREGLRRTYESCKN